VRPDDLAGSHLVAFRCAGQFLHQTPEAQRFWAAEAARRKGSGRTGLCLVCGRPEVLLQTIPQQLPSRLAPGATNSASLVSLNKATHGFALQEQLVHTPICPTCGLAAMSALESLLGGLSSTTLPGQDSRLAWWVTGGAEFDLETLNDPQPQRVALLLGAPARGDSSAADARDDLSVFCALAVGGNVARVVVREWIEEPLPRIRDNVRRWFGDHAMADAWSGEERLLAVNRLAAVTGRWIPGRGEGHGSYAKFGAPGADRPDGVQRALLAAALLGRPLPPKLPAHLVHRVRTDGRVDTERAALVRLALVRRAGATHPEVFMPTLNPENRQPAYLAGRIFATLEDLQLSAARARGDQALNVTFADRYLGRAVTSPAVALVAGQRDAQAWLKRLRRDRPAWAYKAEERLDELFAQLAEAGGVPHGAVLADQMAFILGYHQQRAATRRERAGRASSDQLDDAS
jgi:CRISPR-associated protein Csd1